MITNWPIFLASLIGGALIAAQGPIYARMASGFGHQLTATLIAFWIATLAITAICVFARAPMPRLAQVQNMPWWVWLGALIGVYQVLVSISAVPKLGVGTFIVIVVFGQMIAAQLYDHFGWFGLEQRALNWRGILGLTLMCAGILVIQMRPE